MKKNFAILAAFLLIITTFAAAQQDKSKRASPPANAECKFPDGKSIKMDYSSPRIHDPKTHEVRKIYGGLVPFGEVWRTGANEATTFVTDTDLTVGGKEVPAGNYTIFTLPAQDKWTLIINKKTGEWGTPYKYEADELARVDMQVSKTPSLVENFTISFDQQGGNCTMQLDWENTRATAQFAEKK
jgi:hypothetical protein